MRRRLFRGLRCKTVVDLYSGIFPVSSTGVNPTTSTPPTPNSISFSPITVPEDSNSGFVVGTATSTEPSPTWSLTVDAGGFFAVSTGGSITLTSTGAAGLDFNTQSAYSIEISDGASVFTSIISVTEMVAEPFVLDNFISLQLPVDANGQVDNGSATTVTQPQILTYENPLYFQRGSSFVFTVPSNGARLSNGNFPRCELRGQNRQWDQVTRDTTVATVRQLPTGHRTVIMQALDGGGSSAGVYKIRVNGGTAGNSNGVLSIEYDPIFGGSDTSVDLRTDLSVDTNGVMEQIAVSVVRYPNKLEVYLGNNVGGNVPDWTSDDHTPFFRDASSGTFVLKKGNYYHRNDNVVVTTCVVALDAGTFGNPTIIGTSAPTAITLTPASVPENYTGLIGQLTATGGDGTLNFSVVSGPVSVVGADDLHLTTAQNFEAPTTSFDAEITVTDGNNASYSQTIAVAVTDVNEAPIFSGAPPTLTYAQGVAASATDFSSFLADPEFDAGNAVAPTYSISPAVPTGFTLSSAGVLTPDTSAAVAAASYTVTATDALGLTATTSFTIEVTASAQVAPVGGNKSLSFTVTTDTVGPTLSVAVPADGTVDLAIDETTHTLTFSENVIAGTGVIEIREVGGAVLESFDVAANLVSGTPSAGEIQFTGTQVIFEKSSDYPNLLNVAIHVAATAVEDAAGNTFAGIADDTTLNFSTVAASSSSLYDNELNTAGNFTALDLNHGNQGAGVQTELAAGDIAGVSDNVGHILMTKNGGATRLSIATTGLALSGLTVNVAVEVVVLPDAGTSTLSIVAGDTGRQSWAIPPSEYQTLVGTGSTVLTTFNFSSIVMTTDQLAVYVSVPGSGPDFLDQYAVSRVTITQA